MMVMEMVDVVVSLIEMMMLWIPYIESPYGSLLGARVLEFGEVSDLYVSLFPKKK